ncbi:hypothetical protein [Mesorhizobium sp. M0254]|uniref:hypothetical protein n=1 Tax=Mesorhizobium sp. M0254 TaxID=2956927 RepID=UPI003336020D
MEQRKPTEFEFGILLEQEAFLNNDFTQPPDSGGQTVPLPSQLSLLQLLPTFKEISRICGAGVGVDQATVRRTRPNSIFSVGKLFRR